VLSSTYKEQEPRESAIIEELLSADWGLRKGQPLSSDELLVIGRKAFEPLFDVPPIGPIPEYLAPQWSVHGCVAEFEDQIEELDRWKALELSRWLKARVGRTWCVDGKVYQLQAQQDQDGASDKFWFRGIEDQC
jgi:hypothetical protein